MRIETYGQQLEVTPAMREYVETKLQRLERHFDRPLEVRTQLCVRKPDYVAEATVMMAGKTVHADAGAPTMYAAIDVLVDKLDRLVMKVKRKRESNRRIASRSVAALLAE
jgi:putative sigma-54 modulation protein